MWSVRDVDTQAELDAPCVEAAYRAQICRPPSALRMIIASANEQHGPPRCARCTVPSGVRRMRIQHTQARPRMRRNRLQDALGYSTVATTGQLADGPSPVTTLPRQSSRITPALGPALYSTAHSSCAVRCRFTVCRRTPMAPAPGASIKITKDKLPDLAMYSRGLEAAVVAL